MAWENWPQTNVHELNLDWMLNKIKELSAQLETNLEPVYDAIAKGDSNTLASAKNYADSVGDSSINHTNDLVADLADQLSNAISNIYQSISSGDLSTLSYVNSEVLKIYDELNKIKYNFENPEKTAEVFERCSMICITFE